MKKYKCKICGWRGKLNKITVDKTFNEVIRKFVYDGVVCQRCNCMGLVERKQTFWYWILLAGAGMFAYISWYIPRLFLIPSIPTYP